MSKNKQDEMEDAYYIEGGKLLAHPLPGEEIVISGMAGVMPNSRDLAEFRENLFNKVNMVLPNKRFVYEHPEMPICSGSIPEINRYDAGFFGVHNRQADSLDIMNRILQEKVVEAIFDAGMNLSDLEGTNTGVYIGVCLSENDKTWFYDKLGPQMFSITGCERSMLAHRISYFLKLKSQSTISDTACSSSLHSLENAYNALRLGEIDTAIVGGTNLCLHPFTTMQFLRLGVLSVDGCCKAFDETGNGYARSEAFGVVILQKAKVAKRIYAEVVHIKTNSDGYKEQGITFPSQAAQTKLLSDIYKDCDIDRTKLTFLEAHGTGTIVGDPEECAAIDQVFTNGRTTPLLIGSVKSNIGHSEPASGLCSVFKCVFAMETGYIPPNIHFNTPKKEIKGIIGGRMKVVVDKTPLPDENGLLGIDNFGFGGSNAHVLLKWHPKRKSKSSNSSNVPKLVCVSGRTEEAVTVLLNQIFRNKMDDEYITLVHNVFRKHVPNHLYRGYTIVSNCGEVSRLLEFCPESEPPLYVAFGELENWFDIGKQLMALPIFSQSIQRINKNVMEKGINILDTFLHKPTESNLIPVIGSVAVQIAIADILNLLDVKAVSSYGYSFGELVSAYYSGVLTLDETINCAIIVNESLLKGLQNKYNIKDNHICNGNHITNGDQEPQDNFNDIITNNKPIRELLQKNLANVLKGYEKRNNVNKNKITDYLVNALARNGYKIDSSKINSVILKVDEDPLVEEADLSVINLFKRRDEKRIEEFLATLGRLYLKGYNPQIERLYPEIEFPVSKGTSMISPYIKWKHNREIFTINFNRDMDQQSKHRVRLYRIQMIDHQWAYIAGHVIDGRNLFPATGYLYMVWETFGVMNGIQLNVSRVTMENCRFMRATNVPSKNSITFSVFIQSGTGNFEVVEGNTTIVSGRIKILPECEAKVCDLETSVVESHSTELDKKDVYKELRLRGYNYSGEFKSIEKYVINSSNLSTGYISWNENWVAFMDNMLQTKIMGLDSRSLYVPVFISKLNIVADIHGQLIKKKFKDSTTSTILPVYSDNITGEIKCGGITISGLLASPIARKKNLAIPVLETYEFVPNFAKLDRKTSIKANAQILLENALTYKVKVVELIDDSADENAEPLTPILNVALQEEPLVQPSVIILSRKTFNVDIEQKNKNLGSESDCLLVIASKVMERPDILNQAFGALKKDGYIMSRESVDFDIRKCADPNIAILTIHKTTNETIVLLQKLTHKSESHYLKINSSQNFSWVPKVQTAINTNQRMDLVLYTDKNPTNGILGLVNCLRREPEGRNIRCVFIMDESVEFNPDSPTHSAHLNKNMAVNVYKNGQWGSYRHLLLNETNAEASEHSFVALTGTGDLSTLRWTQGPLTGVSTMLEEELVQVYYSSLNFKDVMLATGKLNSGGSTNRLNPDCMLGFEFSGRDKRGNRVMGSGPKALANMIFVDPMLIYPVPNQWTLEEAATVPVVYLTVLYAVFIRGNMKRGESILIHSGTGGIGQAAIYIALHYGCQVYTTVGSQEKRDFLKRKYPQLKDENIGNSHDESFEELVYTGTNGRGVDLVLNSLAEEKLIASVRCLAQRGRFLEIGKFDLSSNNFVSMLLFQKQGEFHGISLDFAFINSPETKLELKKIFHKLLKEGAIKPLERTVFKCDEIEQAFRFLATGKHMGKVMIKIREPEDKPVIHPSVQKLRCTPRYYCKEEGVYIIVGGLGGFGLELADWLVIRGARKLVLTSKKGISTGYQSYRIRLWKSYGVTVKVSTTPLDTREGCKRLIEEGFQLGPVYAIFNLAVVLADAIFQDQTPESFITSFTPKAFATEYLDDLTRKMCPDLRDFVVFSSVSCGRGNMGQTNYGMANSVMERICEKRKHEGYPALAIEWGAIGEVGLVAEMQENHMELEISGTLQQRISSCLQILDTFLTQKMAAIVSSMVVAEKKGSQSGTMVDAVINLIGIQDIKSVSVHSTLAELGMDSMTAVEIRQVLERDFEVILSARDLRTMTIDRLKTLQDNQDGAVENLQIDQSSEMLVQTLFRIITDEADSKIPSLPISRCSEKSGKPKFILFPGIEGFAVVFSELASYIKDATAVQYVVDGQTTNIANIVKSVMPTVEKQLPRNGPFTIVAYSYGTLIALEVVNLLESLGFTGTLICVDGSPLLMKYLLKNFHQESEKIFQNIMICQLLSFCISNEKLSENKASIIKCDNFESKLNFGIDLIKDSIAYNPHYLKILANTIYARLKDIQTYTPSYKNLRSNIKLVKPTTATVHSIVEDYGLSEYFQKPVEIQYLKGNHETVIQNVKLADLLNTSSQKFV